MGRMASPALTSGIAIVQAPRSLPRLIRIPESHSEGPHDKEVTVVIELRARFEEEANIELASDLQEAGAHVVYGIVGHKTHAKMTLVVRREGWQLHRYVHLGTGNYHARTARPFARTVFSQTLRV
jgi:polyphosphate kinase